MLNWLLDHLPVWLRWKQAASRERTEKCWADCVMWALGPEGHPYSEIRDCDFCVGEAVTYCGKPREEA